MFKIGTSCHNMLCIEKTDLTREQAEKVRSFILANHMDDPRYQAKKGVNPFLQGYDYDPKPDGKHWVLIEFWSDKKDLIEQYVDLLNREVWGDNAVQQV